MKVKMLFFVALCVVFQYSVYSESTTAGILFGYHRSLPDVRKISELDTSLPVQQNSRLLGTTLGIFVSSPISRKENLSIDLQPELFYKQSYSHVITDEQPGEQFDIQTTYFTLFDVIQFQSLLKVQYRNACISLGPYVSFIIKADQGYIQSNIYESSITETYYKIPGKQNFKSFDYGLVISSGIQVTTKFSIKVRYEHGMPNVKQEDSILLDFPYQKNRGVYFISTFSL